MSNEELAKRMLKLFKGFDGAYGTEAGGCKWEPVDTDLMIKHLSGECPIGIYPMIPPDELHDEWTVTWGCVDIDEGFDDWEEADKLATMLEALELNPWIEPSRSKGFHVWVFAHERIPASIMRRALSAACQLFDLKYDAVYPKQESLPEGSVGNYVRLPYCGNRKEGRQQVGEWTLEEFLDAAEEDIVDKPLIRVALVRAAALYRTPDYGLAPRETPKVVPRRPAGGYDTDPLKLKGSNSGLPPLARTMIERGPTPHFRGSGAGKGRHGWIHRFARELAQAGWTSVEIIKELESFDRDVVPRWWPEEGPKFHGRGPVESRRQYEMVATHALNYR